MTKDTSQGWDVGKSGHIYQIDRWGSAYFSINEKGHVAVSPLKEKGATLDLSDVVDEAKAQGLHFPLVVRFQDLLRHQVTLLNEAFHSAIQDNQFKGNYRGVFPIKVNQMREVVEEILEAGQPYHFGLEAGSKPEMAAALALHKDTESLIICNGYKDADYIRLALTGRKLEKKVFLVVEKIEELQLIINLSRQMNVTPWIGFRLRLHSKGAGKWATSGGENAKFGLCASELVEACDILTAEGLNDSFKLLHFHIGSQIPDIQVIKRAVREATRYYAKIRQLGFPVEYMDVGGGLGVDYDGSRGASDSSTNYSTGEYCADVVYNIAAVCEAEKVPHPHIISESGRAVVSHHSVLVVEVLGAAEKTKAVKPLPEPGQNHKMVEDMLDLLKNIKKGNRREIFHDTQQIREESETMFHLGMLDLRTKAQIEDLHWLLMEKVWDLSKHAHAIPDEIRDLEVSLSDQYLCNFSVFQSLLDHWALGQVFPIMPLQRLDEEPTQPSMLVDITCDSDGKISQFIGHDGLQKNLPLHEINGKPYHVCFFLVGAYQDVMGDIHNLFGRVNEAHVFLDPDEESGFYIEETIEGETISEVLDDVQYNIHELASEMKMHIDQAIKTDRIKPSEGMRLLQDYERLLKQPTYLNISTSKHEK